MSRIHVSFREPRLRQAASMSCLSLWSEWFASRWERVSLTSRATAALSAPPGMVNVFAYRNQVRCGPGLVSPAAAASGHSGCPPSGPGRPTSPPSSTRSARSPPAPDRCCGPATTNRHLHGTAMTTPVRNSWHAPSVNARTVKTHPEPPRLSRGSPHQSKPSEILATHASDRWFEAKTATTQWSRAGRTRRSPATSASTWRRANVLWFAVNPLGPDSRSMTALTTSAFNCALRHWPGGNKPRKLAGAEPMLGRRARACSLQVDPLTPYCLARRVASAIPCIRSRDSSPAPASASAAARSSISSRRCEKWRSTPSGTPAISNSPRPAVRHDTHASHSQTSARSTAL